MKLTLLSPSISDFFGLAPLGKLRLLRVALARRLKGLEGLESLANLEVIDLNLCKHVDSIKPLEGLNRLTNLSIDNCGAIESLAPIMAMPNLKALSFVESTNIVDGDLSYIEKHSSLKAVTFQNRRAYSHWREDFP